MDRGDATPHLHDDADRSRAGAGEEVDGVAAPGAVPAAAGVAKVAAAAAWVEDAVGIDLQLQAEAAPLAMVLAAAAAGVGVDDDHEVHRRVLQARGGGYVNPSLVANRQSCTRSCPARGGSYTGRGNLCIFHNRSC
uniref:Uncharacterized protein n=1 Tax=Oryza punctata TaxID=4537 RepID=A0A0E0KPQ5_ORYPU